MGGLGALDGPGHMGTLSGLGGLGVVSRIHVHTLFVIIYVSHHTWRNGKKRWRWKRREEQEASSSPPLALPPLYPPPRVV